MHLDEVYCRPYIRVTPSGQLVGFCEHAWHLNLRYDTLDDLLAISEALFSDHPPYHKATQLQFTGVSGCKVQNSGPWDIWNASD